MERIPSPLQNISDPLFTKKGIEVWIKRDDLIHPYVMGNKWRKLKLNILHAKDNDHKGLVTFGGAYSNHIAATAAACAENGLSSVGIIRGEELTAESNSTLNTAHEQGMKLEFVTRSRYKALTQDIGQIRSDYPNYHIVPEGGSNHLAIEGCQDIVNEISVPFDHIVTSVATGGTMAGLIKALKGQSNVIGILALKGEGFHESFHLFLHQHDIHDENYMLSNDWHWGGYAKVPDELIDFINSTKNKIDILFDPIYTAKMYYAVLGLIKDNYFKRGSRIVLLHTGGLQGTSGINQKSAKKILL